MPLRHRPFQLMLLILSYISLYPIFVLLTYKLTDEETDGKMGLMQESHQLWKPFSFNLCYGPKFYCFTNDYEKILAGVDHRMTARK